MEAGKAVLLYMNECLEIRWIPLSEWKEIPYDVAHFLLAFLYLVLLCLCTYMFFKYVYNSHKMFTSAFWAATTVRCVWFALQPLRIEGILTMYNSINFLLNTLPTFLYFTDYMVLLAFWAQVYRSVDYFKKRQIFRKFNSIFLLVNGIIFSSIGVLYTLDIHSNAEIAKHKGVTTSLTPFEQAILIYITSLYILVSLSFFVFGYYTFRTLAKRNMAVQKSEEHNKLLRKVGLITLISMFCFLVRAALVLYNLFQTDITLVWWTDGLYFFALEVIPATLMLFAYRAPKEQNSGWSAAAANNAAYYTDYKTFRT